MGAVSRNKNTLFICSSVTSQSADITSFSETDHLFAQLEPSISAQWICPGSEIYVARVATPQKFDARSG